ncbi:MAG: SUMF1/EgtB/PvdO family nonheme iron enzyme [Chthoniobacteraceae bacterium]
MVYIPAGVFQIGDNFNESAPDTLPLHSVTVNPMFMDKYEVTKELWLAVQTWALGHGYTSLSSGSYKASGHPVQSVSWYDMVKWCNPRSEREGLTPCYYTDDAQTFVYKTGNVDVTNVQVKWTADGYRLPTEAEWEKAARGGILGARFPWGDTINGSQANYSGSGDALEGQFPETTPVGYYDGNQTPTGVDMANGYGLYDMAGNVWEWVWDRYDPNYYSDVTANNNPRGPAMGTKRVLRGGAWGHTATDLRCAYRLYNYSPATTNSAGFGFRCARGL